MQLVYKLLKLNFEFIYYFYRNLKYRIFISLFLSFSVGVMDGFGLAMFLPLLQLSVSNNVVESSIQMGNLDFFIKGLQMLGLNLTLNVTLCIIFFFFLIKGILKYAEGYVRVKFEQIFIRNIRISNIQGLSNFQYKNFIKLDQGRIQNTLSGEVEKVIFAYRSFFTSTQYFIFIAVYITMAFFANSQFAILVLAGAFLINLMFKKLVSFSKNLSVKVTSDSHVFQGLLLQQVSFFKYLKATDTISSYINKLQKNINEISRSQFKLGVINSFFNAAREPLVILVVIGVIMLEIILFHQKFEVILLSLLLFYRSLTYLMGLQNHWNYFISVSGSLRNIQSFQNQLEEGREMNGEIVFERFTKKIVLNNVSFDYDGKAVLKNINLSLHKNQTVAIVGASGSGKTTFMNLLAGLLQPTKGTIEVDGVLYQNLKINSFRSRIGYITQDPVIFNDTIFNNVTFWDEPTESNLQRFYNALEKAAIKEYVVNLYEKERSILGTNGINISGGQKQRISIAREFYKDIDFLFLDEATSALDSETENIIKESLDKFKGTLTIVIIAHRLSTIKNADVIILLDEGAVIDYGIFADMVTTSPVFKKMIDFQHF